MCIDGRFFEGCFYYYSQQILSAAANESLIPYNLLKKVPKNITFNTATPNATRKEIKENIKYSSAFRTKDLFHTEMRVK